MSPPPNSQIIKSTKIAAKYYLTENVQLNNQTADLFVLEIENKGQVTNPNTKEVSDFIDYRMEKHWISKDGLLLKWELTDRGINPEKIRSRRSWIYEYDPNIKIEAPIK